MNLGKNIAIIGAGPASLAAAEALTAIGYKNITLFEKNPEAGGMVVSGEDTCTSCLSTPTPDEPEINFKLFLSLVDVI